jgi:long-subunit fatty acid transport protein
MKYTTAFIKILNGFIIVLISLISLQINAQENDFQIWSDVSAKYKLHKKWRLDGELGLRTRENSTLLRQIYLEFGGRYKINKRFDISGKYRFSNYYRFGKTNVHRWTADLSYDNKWKRFTWGLRGRYQQNWFVSNYSQEYYVQTWRTKFEISYDIRKNKLQPSFSLEHFMGLNGKEKWLTTGLRWSLGADYPINKWSDISLSYKIETEFYTANPLTAYILSISYKVDLN